MTGEVRRGRPTRPPPSACDRLEAVALLVLHQDLRLRGGKLVENLLGIAAADHEGGGLAGALGAEEDVATAGDGRKELDRLGERSNLRDQRQEAFAFGILELIGLSHFVA